MNLLSARIVFLVIFVAALGILAAPIDRVAASAQPAPSQIGPDLTNTRFATQESAVRGGAQSPPTRQDLVPTMDNKATKPDPAVAKERSRRPARIDLSMPYYRFGRLPIHLRD